MNLRVSATASGGERGVPTANSGGVAVAGTAGFHAGQPGAQGAAGGGREAAPEPVADGRDQGAHAATGFADDDGDVLLLIDEVDDDPAAPALRRQLGSHRAQDPVALAKPPGVRLGGGAIQNSRDLAQRRAPLPVSGEFRRRRVREFLDDSTPGMVECRKLHRGHVAAARARIEPRHLVAGIGALNRVEEGDLLLRARRVSDQRNEQGDSENEYFQFPARMASRLLSYIARYCEPNTAGLIIY